MEAFTVVVNSNIITSMQVLCTFVSDYGNGLMQPDSYPSWQAMMDLKDEREMSEEIGNHCMKLWADPGIQQTYLKHDRFQFSDSAEYFFQRIPIIMQPGYVPTLEDILRCRVRTTGIVELEFMVGRNRFIIVDVGGQRNERKKWIHCFENVTAVLFVAALSEYCQTMYEDARVNRMVESLNLFEEVCNMPWFEQTSIILFLNKCDLFKERLQREPLQNYMRDYAGNNQFADGCNWIRRQYEARNHNKKKMIYWHVTCATDTDSMQQVFNAVHHIIVRISLRRAGLVS